VVLLNVKVKGSERGGTSFSKKCHELGVVDCIERIDPCMRGQARDPAAPPPPPSSAHDLARLLLR
jgi:hypothetical protein